jgi:tripartite-type tricarboxylate transporter receptor subunit TctC
MLNRIQRAACAVALAAAALAGQPVTAQDYPSRSIVIIVPQGAGGGTDIIARLIGHQLSIQLGQNVVIENRTGAGSVVGTVAAAHAAPDGYTLLAGLTANMAVNPSVYVNLAYDPIRDFTPIGMLSEYPFVLMVNKDLPVHSVKELIALAKSKPGEINFASAGNGSGQQLSMELFKLMTDTKLTHVPYRGSAPAYTDVISGQTQVFFDNLASALGHIKGGNVRALAVTGTQRSPLIPDVPTVAETVPGFQNYVWFGLWAPKGTPQPVVAKLNAELKKALATPAVRDRIVKDAGVPLDTPIANIEPMVKAEIVKWADVVKRANVPQIK